MQPMHNKHRIATLLALTVALAGCGGGTDKHITPAPAPTPAPCPGSSALCPIGSELWLPSNNVLEGRVRLDALVVNVFGRWQPSTQWNQRHAGSESPQQRAAVAPVAPSTVGGVASATLSVGSSVAASATFPGQGIGGQAESNTATDTVTYYVRPTTARPCRCWCLRTSAAPAHLPFGTRSPPGATSYPDVQITAIANPHNGVITASTKVDADALKAITAFKAVTGTTNKVLGYVATASGSSGGFR